MTVTRGTTNGNDRGSSTTRRRRREWLVETYRADQDVQRGKCDQPACPWFGNDLLACPWDEHPHHRGQGEPACRCYRCGLLLTADTLTVDRIVPGCQGGTYRRTNIRPACGPCNSETGGATRRTPPKARRTA